MTYHSGNQLIDPYLLFEKAQMRPGMHVADFGCGRTGHLVFPAAKILGERGEVYAVDILKDLLKGIKERAAMSNLLNIQTVWSNLENVGRTAIPKNSLDAVFLLNVLVQSKKSNNILTEAKRLLKEKGRMIIVDWAKKGLAFGPPDDHFIDFESIKQWARENGLAVQEEFTAGIYHKGLVLYKQE